VPTLPCYIIENTWWQDAFPELPYQRKPPGAKQMLTVVAYDIAQPKRLAKVARICQDYGIRVQYSIFESHLTEEDFDGFWLRLLDEIDEEEDRIVAYRLDAKAARRTLTAGKMVCSEKVLCYMI
jgi:CRISPR-associated protein Cas2